MNQFDTVEIKKPAKNVFNLSHDVKATYNFDKLYPFLCQPIYPGDTFNARAEVFMRAMPMLAPVMHNVDMHIYFFFVPMRLVWNENKKRDWKVFITGGEDGLQNPTLPYFDYNSLANIGQSYVEDKSLLDYMGFPTVRQANVHSSTVNEHICSLPFRAYQLIYNEYFRNQNVQNEIEFSYDAGQESAADLEKLFSFRYKNWEKDYFTSCLPWAQRGEAVKLPITGNGSISGSTLPVSVNSARVQGSLVAAGLETDALSTSYNSLRFAGSNPSGTAVTLEGTATISSGSITFTGLEVGTINDFRACLRLQQWLENNARCGSRYIEQLLSHFGVVSSDARLQRPELLGGGKIPLIFTDVPQTSYGDGTSPNGDANVLGDLAGKGTLYGKTGGFKKYFEEHGILLGICCILPRTSYQDFLPRVWTALDKTDWYFPEFAHLGEQAVLRKEVYFNPNDVYLVGDDGPNGVFGYQGRFTELRYIPSSVHGELKSSLQAWHFGRVFDRTQHLNSDFVKADSRVNVFAIEDIRLGDYDPFVCQMHLDIKAVRPLPKYAIPTL